MPAWRDAKRVTVNDFSPAAFEAYGRLGIATDKMLGQLATRNAAAWGVDAAAERHRWRGLLTLRLQLDQAEILLEG